MSHDYFVWMSYGATLLAVIVEIVALRIGRSHALARIDEERDLEAQD
jgi:heme exporter protein CcmD